MADGVTGTTSGTSGVGGSVETGRKGLFVLFGPVGASKSTEAMTCFQNALLLSTRPNQIGFFRQWLLTEEGRASGKRLPVREIVIDAYALDGEMTFGPNGLPLPVPQRAMFEYYVLLAIQKIASEWQLFRAGKLAAPTYRNLVIDEAGTFWERIFEEVAPTITTKDGRADPRRAYGAMNGWTLRITELLRQLVHCGANVCLVTHDRDPDAAEGRKGGPNVISDNIGRKIASAADGVLMRVIVDKPHGGIPPPPPAPGAPGAPGTPTVTPAGILVPPPPLLVPAGLAGAPLAAAVPSSGSVAALGGLFASADAGAGPDANSGPGSNVPPLPPPPAAGFTPVMAVGQREWRVHCSERWTSKLVGLPDSMFDEIRTWPLEKILRAAGYEP